MGRGFYRFLFVINVVGITEFLINVLVFRKFYHPIYYGMCCFNTCFTILYIWKRCEFDTTWYDTLVRQIKWRYKKWKSKR